jgi:nitrite reductase (NADH) large subunit
MIVCHCNRVNDRAIRAAICDGACSVGEIADRCGAAASCGGCAPAVEEILEAEHHAVRRLPVVDYVAVRV